jgi:TPR repeat protein
MFGLGKSALDKGLDAFALGDWKRARRHLHHAGEARPSAAGDYHLGLLYWRGLGGPRDVAAAVRHFERAANEGHVAAQTAFAMALRSGVGVRKDEDAARKLFRAAAAGDDIDAMIQLATMSEPEEAKHWLGRAAESGHPAAMRYLSDMLARTEPIAALAWLYAAATIASDDDARKRAGALAKEMSATEIDNAQRLGRDHVKRLQRRARERR